jgi:hypothetical protein
MPQGGRLDARRVRCSSTATAVLVYILTIFSFWGVFWIDVSTPDRAKSDFIVIGEMLGQKTDSVKQACRLLANTRKRCLLILDNADDPNFDYNVYVPSGIRGAILITSRCADLSQFSTATYEALQDLGMADCSELILRAAKLPREQWATQEGGAKDIVHLLRSHTLAPIHTGAYVAKGHCKLEEYIKVFRQNRKRLLKYSPIQAQSPYGDVYATFEASASVLSANSLALLGVLSMLNHTALPESIFERAWKGARQVSTC